MARAVTILVRGSFLGVGLVIALGPPASAASATRTASPVATATSTAAAPSSAPDLGFVTVQPAAGNEQVVLALVTTKSCPPGGTNVIGTMFGPGLPTFGVNIVTNTTAKLFPRTVAGGYYLISNNTLRNLLSDQAPDVDQLKGTYRVRVQCRGPATVADLGDFYGSVVFNGHHAFTAKEPAVAASALATLPPVTDPPIPSQRPAATPTPAAVTAKKKAVKTSGLGASAPWLMGGGSLIAALGLSAWIRGKRARRVASR